MKKKGFTLIELLAVIVILAIIAVIATPMVLNTIDDARKGAAKSSATTYMKELETEVIKSMMTTTPIKAGKYKVGDIVVNVKGDAPTEGYVCVASDGTVEKASVLLNDYVISYDGKEATTTDKEKVEEIDCGESYVVGDAVTIDGIGYHVIKKSSSTDEYVTLLRDESIGNFMFDENGGTDYETSTIKTYLNTVYKETFGEKEQYIQEITLLDFDSEVVWVNESEGSRIDYNESGKEEGTLVYLYKNYRDTFFEIESIDASIYDWRYDQIQSHLLTKTVVFPNDDPDYLGILHSGVVYNFVKAYDLDGNFAGYEPFLASTTIDFPVRPVITISKKALD